jgi:cobalt-zinc-cadmium efflux system membrane fusion protein
MLFCAACKNEKNIQATPENDYIEITKEQFLSENMMVGTPQKIRIEEGIPFSGKIISAKDGIAKISASIEGLVSEVMVNQGQSVERNAPLFKIGGNAFIQLQQEFASSAAKINQLKANYERAKMLYGEDIKTENEFMLAESEYLSERATYNALALKLQQIGLDVSIIKQGVYVSDYTITSPISGQLNKLNVLPGQYVNRETELAEIVNINKAELQLSFYEKDVRKIKQGQVVYFNSLMHSEFNAKAVLTRVGLKLSDTSNALECYASINNDSAKLFAINQMVHGQVIVAADSVWAVPRTAIVSQGDDNYMITVVQETGDVYQFVKQKVKIGKSDKDNVELPDVDNHIRLCLKGVENMVME